MILPFYLRGLWGSVFSCAERQAQGEPRGGGRARDVVVAFGATLPKDANAERVKQAVFELSVSSWQTHTEMLPTLPEAWLRAAKRRMGSAVRRGLRRYLAEQPALHGGRASCSPAASAGMGAEPNLGVLMPASSAGAIANLAGLLTGKAVVNLNYTRQPRGPARRDREGRHPQRRSPPAAS